MFTCVPQLLRHRRLGGDLHVGTHLLTHSLTSRRKCIHGHAAQCAGRALCARTNATGSLMQARTSKREKESRRAPRTSQRELSYRRRELFTQRRGLSLQCSQQCLGKLHKKATGRQAAASPHLSSDRTFTPSCILLFYTQTDHRRRPGCSESDEVPRPLLGTRTCCNFRNRFRCKSHFLELFRKKIGL